MYATRVIAGLLAGAIGAVAGAAATIVVAFLGYGTWTLVPFSSNGTRTYRLSVAVFGIVFIPVMVAVFRQLERLRLVGEPPTSHNALGLSDHSPERHDDVDGR
jgi:hypothetical protein